MSLVEMALMFMAAVGASLIVNGDFEKGLDNWSTNHSWYEQPKGAGLSEVVIADGEGHDGGKTLKLVSKGNRGIVMQVFAAYPGRYKVSGWIRCQGLGDARAGVLLEWMARDNKWLRGDWAVEVTGDQEWKRFETVLEAHPDTRSVHFDLIVTSPNNGTVWFDDIACERLPGDLPTPQPPRVTAETPQGAEGCLQIAWDPASLTPGTVRLLIYCEPKPFDANDQLVPKAVADADEGKVSVWSLENGRTYHVAVMAVNADMQASGLGERVTAQPQDRQPPRPGWLAAEALTGGRVQLSWSPHILDRDVKTIHFCVRAAEGQEPHLLKSVDVATLYDRPRPFYCVAPWISEEVVLPAGIDLASGGVTMGVFAEDRPGNRSETQWVDATPLGAYPDAEAPCVLTTATPTTQVRRDSAPPEPGDLETSFELCTLRGEPEGFQVLVWPTQTLHRVRVRFEPLVSEDGKSRIAPEWLAYHFVDYCHIEKNSRATPKEELLWEGPSDYPDELADDPVRDLPAGQCQPVFIRITAPPNATAGTYHGKAYLEAAEGRRAFDINLRVSSIRFPDKVTLKFVYWFSWDAPCKQFGVEQYSEDGWRVLYRMGELMTAYHQNVVVVPWSLVQTWQRPDGTLVHDFSRFDRFIRTFQQAGVDTGFCISHMGSRTTGEWDCPTMSAHNHRVRLAATGEERWISVLELLPALQQRAEELGILERTMVHVADEPTKVNVESYRELSAKVRQAAPQLRRIDAIHVPDLRGSLEVWVPQLNYFEQWLDQYKAAQAEGYEIWFYVAWVPQGKYPNRMIDSAAIKSRVLHWLNFIHNTSGYLHWALNHWSIPLSSLESPGDQYICWPSTRFIADSSLRYEAERDGLEDCELMFMLRRELERRGVSPGDAHRRVAHIAEEAVRGFQDYTRSWEDMNAVRQRLLAELEKLTG